MSIQQKLKHEMKEIVRVTLLLLALPCQAQDIEPRRWSHLPLGSNFGGIAYAYTEGDIFFNPVQRIEDSMIFFTANDEFFNGMKHEEDPYLVGQGHLIYTFMSGLWLGASVGDGYGGESSTKCPRTT